MQVVSDVKMIKDMNMYCKPSILIPRAIRAAFAPMYARFQVANISVSPPLYVEGLIVMRT